MLSVSGGKKRRERERERKVGQKYEGPEIRTAGRHAKRKRDGWRCKGMVVVCKWRERDRERVVCVGQAINQ